MKKKNKKEQIEDLVKTILGGYAKDGTANATHIKGKDRDDYAAAKVSLSGAGAVGESANVEQDKQDFEKYGVYGLSYITGDPKEPKEPKKPGLQYVRAAKPKPVGIVAKVKNIIANGLKYIPAAEKYPIKMHRPDGTNVSEKPRPSTITVDAGHEPIHTKHKTYHRNIGKPHVLEDYLNSKKDNDVKEEDPSENHGLFGDFEYLCSKKTNESVESTDPHAHIRKQIEALEAQHAEAKSEFKQFAVRIHGGEKVDGRFRENIAASSEKIRLIKEQLRKLRDQLPSPTPPTPPTPIKRAQRGETAHEPGIKLVTPSPTENSISKEIADTFAAAKNLLKQKDKKS